MREGMNTPTPEQIAKLPKWAQEHIHFLQRWHDEAQAKLKEYLDTQSPSAIYTGHEVSGDVRFIQDNCITFVLPHGTVTVWVDGDHLNCNAHYGSAGFFVQPQSSNVVHLSIRED